MSYVIATKHDDWEQYTKKAIKKEAIEDYSDVCILIKYSGNDHNHDHINPIYLEKVND